MVSGSEGEVDQFESSVRYRTATVATGCHTQLVLTIQNFETVVSQFSR